MGAHALQLALQGDVPEPLNHDSHPLTAPTAVTVHCAGARVAVNRVSDGSHDQVREAKSPQAARLKAASDWVVIEARGAHQVPPSTG